jgi:hypothetical protein
MAALVTALLHDSENGDNDDDEGGPEADDADHAEETAMNDTSIISDITDDGSYGEAPKSNVPPKDDTSAEDVQVISESLGSVKIQASGRSKWLTVTIATYDAEIAAMISSSLTSYALFTAVCDNYPVISLHISEEMVANNYYSIRPDGWCWYTLYSNLYLIRCGQQPRILCYEDPNDVAVLSEAMDFCLNHMKVEQRSYIECRHEVRYNICLLIMFFRILNMTNSTPAKT